MAELVKSERREIVAIVTVADSPAADARNARMLEAISKSLSEAIADPVVLGVVLTCAGSTFVSGADITEPGNALEPFRRDELLAVIENSPKPVVAAMCGKALAGGLEVALACHFRVATDDTKFCFPEIKLGLLPTSGGTQRLPRAVGPELAVKMIVGGNPISALEALDNGLLDEIVESPEIGGEVFMRKVLAEKRPMRALRNDDSKLSAAKSDRSIFADTVALVTRRAGQLEAPPAAAKAVENAIDLPFEKGLKKERHVQQIGRGRPIQGPKLCLLRRAGGTQDCRHPGGQSHVRSSG